MIWTAFDLLYIFRLSDFALERCTYLHYYHIFTTSL